MLKIRTATKSDIEGIASLHSKSWQQNYRNTFSDQFLDYEVQHERLVVWKKRFENVSKDQYVQVAEVNGELVGFICAYIDRDSKYGTLIDNLHVSSDFIGQGIGEQLMVNMANFLDQNESNASMYLWVLTSNLKAIKFYERMGGKPVETVNDFDIGDKEIVKTRYHWPDLKYIKALQHHRNAHK